MWGKKAKAAHEAKVFKISENRQRLDTLERMLLDGHDDLTLRLKRLEELVSKAPDIARKKAGVPVVITIGRARQLERDALKRIDLGGTDMLVGCYDLIALLRFFLLAQEKRIKVPCYDEPTEVIKGSLGTGRPTLFKEPDPNAGPE